ncbi:Response regulator receiver domain-containing protein [Aureimonas jatrophae]|uniref:Response regulator receiver domain-containing protein n=2 Tax=Aureimonas jatrophae TaxID=1166073 RepID=A0A1H0GD31_9HYPH|nr:Response regulator receiver domain-containing protein [Aureimonas jatrophae]
MRVLIVEDEPLIAMDLEDIVSESTDADCVWARTLNEGMSFSQADVDFALLDLDLYGTTSLPVADRLADRRIPFCFVTGNRHGLPARFRNVRCVGKPFRRTDIAQVLSGLRW